MLNDGEVFGLGEELFIGVHAGAEHLTSALRAHLGHLLGHLVGSWGGCRRISYDAQTEDSEGGTHTVFTTKQEIEHGLQAKDAQEIPADARHPARIHISRRHARLEHALELDGEREWEFHCTY